MGSASLGHPLEALNHLSPEEAQSRSMPYAGLNYVLGVMYACSLYGVIKHIIKPIMLHALASAHPELDKMHERSQKN